MKKVNVAQNFKSAIDGLDPVIALFFDTIASMTASLMTSLTALMFNAMSLAIALDIDSRVLRL